MVDLDPDLHPRETTTVRGFTQSFVRAGAGGVPILLVHGWPETSRIWWRNVAPLAAAGFEVIAPDLRGFGRSDVGPDGFHDVPSHSQDLYALAHDHLGHDRVIAVGGDLGGPVVADLALRYPGFVQRLVVFNAPVAYDKERMAGMNSRPSSEAADYFIRQGTDPDALAAELATPEQRQRYITTFYASRFWAHPGGFDGPAAAFMAEPFGDGAKLRASFGAYESVFNAAARSGAPMGGRNEDVETLILFGPSDHVIYPEFDRMAAVVYPNHVGPFLVRNAGHFLQWEAADVFNSAVRSFCRDLLPS